MKQILRLDKKNTTKYHFHVRDVVGVAAPLLSVGIQNNVGMGQTPFQPFLYETRSPPKIINVGPTQIRT